MKQTITKNSLLILLISFICLSFSSNASAEVLFGEAYYQTLHKHLTQAEESITIAMYFIYPNFEDPDNPINHLVNDLIDAKQRGVDVKVVLEGSKLNVSRRAYQKLRQNGVKVYFDTPKQLLHVKGIVIDNRYLFLGSANWSKSAMGKNKEATIFVDSPQDAETLTKYINEIPIQKEDVFVPYTSGVNLSADFLLSPKLGRRLLKSHGDKQFDLYLLLCKIQQETGKSQIIIDYESIAKQMGYTELEDLGKYPSQQRYFWQRIHHLLTFLKRYGLIGYQKGEVILKNNDPEKTAIIIPFEFWDYKYSDSLSMVAQYMYLICLNEASRSAKYPVWFRSQKDMAKLYGIGKRTMTKAVSELEEKGILEVTRSKPIPPDFSDRKPNIYKLLPLPQLQDVTMELEK